jgi:NADH-quinone oxidoreductase subunit L
MIALLLVPAFPLLGFLVLLMFGKRLGEPKAGWFGSLMIFASFISSIYVWSQLIRQPAASRHKVLNLFTWFQLGSYNLHFALRADTLSVAMMLFVTGVATVIHVYSIGYMHRDERFHQFFVYLNLFVFSMVVLVTANELPFAFLGWEGVGACSYWLISFWFEKNTAASAGKKAFIINRIGDAGFLLATFLVYENLKTLSFSAIPARAHFLGTGTAVAISLLFFLAAAGKSAQIPLFTWLLDAMEGPTPVSALIHAATMVTAGVYLMARLSPILALAPAASTTIAVVGVATAFIAAMAATSQTDIKKIVAYSTVSQLGYMMLGIGTGDYVAAIFLMITHAFYKALIFLASGSVIHALDGEQNIRKMGALRKLMPVTAVTMILAWLSIAGLPPFSGFFSKGSVLEAAFAKSPYLWVVGAITAILTAYYMGRLVYVVFYGNSRWQEVTGGKQPHESPKVMTVPLVILAVAAVVGGALNLPFHNLQFLGSWLSSTFGSTLVTYKLGGTEKLLLLSADAVAAIVGIVVAWRAWSTAWQRPSLEPELLARGWYVDAFYDRAFARSGTKLAEVTDEVVDPKLIDGVVKGVVSLAVAVGGAGRKVQSGLVRSYLLIMVGGMVVLLGYVFAVAAR